MSNSAARHRHSRGESLPSPLVVPHPDRFAVDASDADVILAAHRRAVLDGADGYVDPVTGMFCFTARYHWEKGACCELGCRHCPWLDADARLARCASEDSDE